ncbi:MAG: glycosyltransferase family 9 protein [bacterium]
MSNTPKRVLLLSLSGIGNFLMQSPIWQTLKKNHPDWEITTWVAPRGTKQLAEIDPGIDCIIEAPIKNSIFGHLNTLKYLRRHHFDIGIVLSPGQLIKSAAYLFLAGIPRRIGHAYPLFNNPHSKLFLTDTIDENDSLHDIEQNLRLLTLVAPGLKRRGFYRLPAPKKTPYNVISTNRRLVGFHPGSAPPFLWKRWPAANFAAVGQSLINNHNAHILIFGGPDEAKLQKELKTRLGQHSTVISTSLLATAALMRRCRLVLSNDSGLMHLAAASGVPTFGLFGPTDEKHTGPRGPKSYVIRAPSTKPVYDTEKNYYLGPRPHPTITAITPEQVLDKILRVV